MKKTFFHVLWDDETADDFTVEDFGPKIMSVRENRLVKKFEIIEKEV